MGRLFKPYHKLIGTSQAIGRKLLRRNLIVLAICLVSVSSLATAYAAMSTTLSIKGQAKVVGEQPIRIAAVESVNPQPSCGMSTYPPTWSSTSFNVDGSLPDLDCTVMFEVVVKNETDNTVYIKEIVEDSFNNSTNMEYEFFITPNTLDAVVTPQSQRYIGVKFRYKDSVVNLPAMTSFVASFHLVFEKVTPPVLAVKGDARGFEIFRGNTTTPPSNLYDRVAAIDDIDGNLTANIVKTCADSIQNIPCPTTWAELNRGDYSVTYKVTNSLGFSATPVSFSIKLWDFVKIAEGDRHVLALSSHGQVWAWGSGSNGALGLGNNTSQTSPTQITDLGDIVDIAASDQTSFAVDSSGNLYSWGRGSSYRLGTNSTSDQSAPIEISPPPGKKYVAVSSQDANGLALTDTGEVYSWGDCYYGSCGAGNNTTRRIPTQVSGLSNIVKISAGHANGGAVDRRGKLWTWGSNYYGQLGVGNSGTVNTPYGNTTSSSNGNVPQPWNDFTNVRDICYGWAHAIVLKDDGSVWVWGNGSYGRIGNGSQSTNQYTPFQLGNVSDGRSCYANEHHSQVVTNSSTLYAWGRNNNYEIGSATGASTSINSPLQILVGDIIVQSTIGVSSSHAIIDGNILIRGWGANGSGQIGDGSTTARPTWVVWNFTGPMIKEW
jgi:alpha-tubulin suppressor-like RCC1 family protein